MSDLDSKQQGIQTGIRFEPVPAGAPPTRRPWPAAPNRPVPGIMILLIGVVLPAIVIAIEAIWRLCAESFFDPMPTLWHALVVAFVPASNLVLWSRLRKLDAVDNLTERERFWLVLANGAAVGIAAFYALIFAPLLPIAVMAIIYFGIGLLPMGPLASLIGAARLRHIVNKGHAGPMLRRAFMGGMAAGLAVLLVLDIPAAATRLGVKWAASDEDKQRQRGIALLRTLGDDDLLLRLCYDTVGRPAGLLSALVMLSGSNSFFGPQRQVAASPVMVREIYYRVRGEPFNARPAPHDRGRWQRFGDFAFDADHGGTTVGGRIKGLSIVASRLDGTVNGDDAVAYLEWTVEFRNVSSVDREARLQLALPPGGVVSRATLWVNGEEREAAYGGKAEVRAAYQRVAVQQRRDPLLVTTKGADRVLTQAFPVPRAGGTIKFKLGITAPLDMTAVDKAQLVLPAIVDRNFSFASDFAHNVWIEGKRPLSTATAGLATQQLGAEHFRLSGPLADVALARTRPVLLTERRGSSEAVAAQVGDGPRVTQQIATLRPPPPSALMLVVDGSARVKTHVPQIIAALEALPATAKVGLLIAADEVRRVVPAPMTPAHKQVLARLLRETPFRGGQDNAPVLTEAMRTLEAEPMGRLVWVHAPQPIVFTGRGGALEHVAARLARLPDVVLYAVKFGPNELLPDLTWSWPARTLARTASTSADLTGYFARTFGEAPVLIAERKAGEAEAGTQPQKGSDHIARLWARDEVGRLMKANATANRPAALKLAVDHRLITPISGAVVLETQQQYDESRLTPVAQATVPTVPEPHEWALLLMACAGLLWLLRRRQMLAPMGGGVAT